MSVNDEIKKIEDKAIESVSTIGSEVKNSSVSFLKRINPWYLILGCVVISIIAYLYFFSGNPTKKENDALKAQIEQIQKERNKVKDSLVAKQNDLLILSSQLNEKENFLSGVNRRLDMIDQKVSISSGQLTQLRGGVNSINDQIKRATERPDKKTGDELLNSLKLKIN